MWRVARPRWTRYLFALRSIPHRPTTRVWTAGGYGPCHRPAYPLCHSGQAQARQARVFDSREAASVGFRPVEGVLSTTPTGGTPTHLQFSASSVPHVRCRSASVVCLCGNCRIHVRPQNASRSSVRTRRYASRQRRERRDSLLESGSLVRRPVSTPTCPPGDVFRSGESAFGGREERAVAAQT